MLISYYSQLLLYYIGSFQNSRISNCDLNTFNIIIYEHKTSLPYIFLSFASNAKLFFLQIVYYYIVFKRPAD